MIHGRPLPNFHHHITHKVRIAGQRTLYFSVHDHEHPCVIFLRVKGPDCSSELIGLHNVIARLVNIVRRYGAPLEKVGDLLPEAKFARCEPLVWQARIKHRSILPETWKRC